MAESEAEYLPLKEAAEYLGISRTTLWTMIREGRIKPYTKPTDKRIKLFNKADLDELKHPRPTEADGRHEQA